MQTILSIDFGIKAELGANVSMYADAFKHTSFTISKILVAESIIAKIPHISWIIIRFKFHLKSGQF